MKATLAWPDKAASPLPNTTTLFLSLSSLHILLLATSRSLLTKLTRYRSSSLRAPSPVMSFHEHFWVSLRSWNNGSMSGSGFCRSMKCGSKPNQTMEGFNEVELVTWSSQSLCST